MERRERSLTRKECCNIACVCGNKELETTLYRITELVLFDATNVLHDVTHIVHLRLDVARPLVDVVQALQLNRI